MSNSARSRVRGRSRSCRDDNTAAAARNTGRDRICDCTHSWYGAISHDRVPASAWDLRTVTAAASKMACATAGSVASLAAAISSSASAPPSDAFRLVCTAFIVSPSRKIRGFVRICDPSADSPLSSVAIRAIAADDAAASNATASPFSFLIAAASAATAFEASSSANFSSSSSSLAAYSSAPPASPPIASSVFCSLYTGTASHATFKTICAFAST
eukprot:29099-Pelagococcus_subviridis.AAC.2